MLGRPLLAAVLRACRRGAVQHLAQKGAAADHPLVSAAAPPRPSATPTRPARIAPACPPARPRAVPSLPAISAERECSTQLLSSSRACRPAPRSSFHATCARCAALRSLWGAGAGGRCCWARRWAPRSCCSCRAPTWRWASATRSSCWGTPRCSRRWGRCVAWSFLVGVEGTLRCSPPLPSLHLRARRLLRCAAALGPALHHFGASRSRCCAPSVTVPLCAAGQLPAHPGAGGAPVPPGRGSHPLCHAHERAQR